MNTIMMVFKNLCILVLWTKVALALEGLRVVLASSTNKIFFFKGKHSWENIGWRMLIRGLPTILLEIFCKIIFNS